MGEPSTDSEPAGRRRFQADVVYVALRDQILRGEVAAGRRLVESGLAEAFNTSRTPVREALRRLEGDGYIVRGAGGSLRPALPDVTAMSELYDVRVVIEELAVRRAAQGARRDLLEAVRADWLALQSELPAIGADFVYADESFHSRLAAASENELLGRILGDLNNRIRSLRIRDFTTPHRVQTTIVEHLEIVETVLLGDGDAAAAFMRAHVQRSALIVRERATVARTRMSRLAEVAP